MFCTNCGKEYAEGERFCTECGQKLETAQPVEEKAVEPVIEAEEPAAAEPVAVPVPVQAQPERSEVPPYDPRQSYYHIPQEPQIPADHKPLSAWAYFGYQLLFSLPVIGFILLIVFSFDNGNINLRNFARSYWCGVLIGVALLVVVLILMVVAGVMVGVNESMNSFV